MLRDALRRLLRDRYDAKTRNRIQDEERGFDPAIWQALADMGVIGALFGEERGGYGGGAFDLALIFEELGRAGALDPLLDTGVLAGGLLADLGSPEQREPLAEVIAGRLQMAFAHGEPQSRYDLERVETRAWRKGGGFVLRGQKAVVVNGAAAGYLVISARSWGNVADEDGISLFLVAADAPGLTFRDYPLMGGGRAAELELEDVHLGPRALLGAEGGAFPAIEARAAAATVALCAEAVGAMEAARALTVDYLRTRKQFGQPIGRFQALQHRMADLLIEIEQARSAMLNVAGNLAQPRGVRELHVSAAKNLIGRAGRLVAEEAIQMHGGIGMTREYDIAHHAKRLVMIDHRLGDSDHHLARFMRLAAAG